MFPMEKEYIYFETLDVGGSKIKNAFNLIYLVLIKRTWRYSNSNRVSNSTPECFKYKIEKLETLRPWIFASLTLVT